jgi:hypothetical protein
MGQGGYHVAAGGVVHLYIVHIGMGGTNAVLSNGHAVHVVGLLIVVHVSVAHGIATHAVQTTVVP